jgi:hypothetical protein
VLVEASFAALSKRQTMLLLAAMTFGGQESMGIFDHLPDDEAELLRHRAQELLQIPRDKRIPVLVQEIKRLFTLRRRGLWSAEPEQLAKLLAHERPSVVEVMLRVLSQELAEAVTRFLPQGLARRAELRHEVAPEVLQIIRHRLEQALVRAGAGGPSFKFSDVMMLRPRELITLADRLGARALAQALAGLPDGERDAFLAQLRPDQRQVAAPAVAQAAARKLGEADARQLLAHLGRLAPAELVRSAGAQRLVRAMVAQSPQFAERVVERTGGPFGTLLGRWLKEERPRMAGKVDGGRTAVMAELEQLAGAGIIDRPIRLTPPPPKPAKLPAPLPGGQVLIPRPRPAPDRLGRPPAREPSRSAEPPARAGFGGPPSDAPRRDPRPPASTSLQRSVRPGGGPAKGGSGRGPGGGSG